MNPLDLETMLERLGIDDYAQNASDAHLIHRLSDFDALDDDSAPRLLENARLLEAQGMALAQAQGLDSDTTLNRFEQAFACWRLISERSTLESSPDVPLPPDLALPFRLAVAGMLAERSADVRMDLSHLLPDAAQVGEQVMAETDGGDWDAVLTRTVASALLLLTRKAEGWSDIGVALSLLAGLREKQAQLEQSYLEGLSDEAQTPAALKLVGNYHVAQMVTTAGEFLERGEPGVEAVRPRLNRHHDQAVDAFASAGVPQFSAWVNLTWSLCRKLVSNSIWTHVEVLGEQVRRFVAELTSASREDPILELWPSQQDAMQRNLFDAYRRAVLVQMPTSGGKTLLAKFSIVQALALNASSPVAYVVPTRALVNQVTRELRRDLRPLGYSVEQTVPAFELDPSEEMLLSQRPNVLVTTPEKLDLLLRTNHPCTHSLSMLVLDEAHGLAESSRGARIELLLATVRRDRPGARFLLLSPFLPNGDQLIDWLGGGRGLQPIYVDWKPSSRVVALLRTEGRMPNRHLVLRTLDAVGNADIGVDKVIELGQVHKRPTSISATTALGASRLRHRGTTLVLTRGKKTAITRANELAAEAPSVGSEPLLDASRAFVDLELGAGNSLSNCLAQGVAYHHAGLSQEVRSVIEGLMSRGLVHTICGTSTLAQGVNFPISQVFIESKRKGDVDLSYADLWNIAGRAGRALKDDVGLVAFPVATQDQADGWQDFLRGEARDIASQLATLIDQADRIGTTFNMASVRTHQGLGALLQYLAHAMKVSGSASTAAEVEDLLRSSLVFHQASISNPDGAAALVRLCRAYIESISGRTGLLAIADSTGFATPSVLNLLAKSNADPSLRLPSEWQPAALFGSDVENLAARIAAIAELPEMSLSDGEGGVFSPERIARILQAWVTGADVSVMATEFGSKEADLDKRAADFSSYLYGALLGRASWGLGALEAVCLSGREGERGDEGYVPSMVYFGVDTPEAVWLRMAGVPRHAARGAAPLWADQFGSSPQSFDQIRDWLGGLTSADWQSAVGNRGVSGDDMRLVWNNLLA